MINLLARGPGVVVVVVVVGENAWVREANGLEEKVAKMGSGAQKSAVIQS